MIHTTDLSSAKGNEGRGIVAPRLVIGTSTSGVTRRVRAAGPLSAQKGVWPGAREVHLIDEPVAAADRRRPPVTDHRARQL